MVGDRLYFLAGERGERWYPRTFGMWVTDGTRKGTRRAHDPSDSWGDRGPRVDYLVEDAGDLLFAKRAPTDPCDPEVWKACGGAAFIPWRTDSTATGAHPFVDTDGKLVGISSDMVRLGDHLYFGGFHQEQGNALLSVGSGSSVAQVVRAFSPKLAARWGHPVPVAALGDRLVFLLDDRRHGRELWVSDGTAEGTELLADIVEGKGSLLLGSDLGYESPMIRLDDRLLFQAYLNDEEDLGTWATDGTAAGTEQLAEALLALEAGDGDRPLVAARDDRHGREPWRTDGTEAGTGMLLDVAPGPADGLPSRLTTAGDDQQLWGWLSDGMVGPYRYFIGDDGIHGREPWVTDGTAEGTRLLLDIHEGPDGSDPVLAAAVGERLFFIADDGASGPRLWVSDGQRDGTRIVSTFDLDGRVSRVVSAFGDSLLVAVDEEGRDMSLWRIDGTTEDAERIWQGRARGVILQELDGTMFFVPWRAPDNTRLWMTDGTRKGTSEITAPKGRRLRFDRGAGLVMRLGNHFVFYADDGRRGVELWSLPVRDA